MLESDKSSRCVMRSKSDPDSIVEGNECSNNDTDDDGDADAGGNGGSSLNVINNAHISAEGHAESGWVSRDEGDVPLFSQPLRPTTLSSAVKIHQSLQKQSNGDDVIMQTQEFVSLPRARRRLLSVHDLPPPSELRNKRKTKRIRGEKDRPVEQHIEQIKKKRATFFASGCSMKVPASAFSTAKEQEEVMLLPSATMVRTDDETDSITLLGVPYSQSALYQPPRLASPERQTASLPDISDPASYELLRQRDDDDVWFRKHWQAHSQPSKPRSQTSPAATSPAAVLRQMSPAESQKAKFVVQSQMLPAENHKAKFVVRTQMLPAENQKAKFVVRSQMSSAESHNKAMSESQKAKFVVHNQMSPAESQKAKFVVQSQMSPAESQKSISVVRSQISLVQRKVSLFQSQVSPVSSQTSLSVLQTDVVHSRLSFTKNKPHGIVRPAEE